MFFSTLCRLKTGSLNNNRKKKKYEGQVAVYYIILYSLGRFFIEGLRTDSLMLGPLRMAQVISLVGVIGGIIAHIYLSKKNNNIKEELTK